MATQNKTTLKNYFSTGKIPTQGQYSDLIDSQLNLSETDTQTIKSPLSASNFNASHHITASGHISASGTGSFGAISVKQFSNITSSGDLSASGDLYISNITASGNIQVQGSASMTHISASGNLTLEGSASIKGTVSSSNISASGWISASAFYGSIGSVAQTSIVTIGTLTGLSVNGDVGFSNGTISFSPTKFVDITKPISASGGIRVTGSISASGKLDLEGDISASSISANHVTASGDISSSGTVYANAIIATLPAGTDNSVVVHNGSNDQLVTDEIDSRVWGSTLADLSNGVNNRLVTATDANSLNGEAYLTFNGSTLAVTGAQTISSTLTVSNLAYSKTFLSNGLDESIPNATTWSNTDSISMGEDPLFRLNLSGLPAVSSKFTSSDEYMIIEHESISINSIITGTSIYHNVLNYRTDMGIEFYNISAGRSYFRITNLAGTNDISDGAGCVFNIIILSI